PVQLDRVHATPTTVAGARMPTPGPARRTARRLAVALLLATAGCGGDSNGPVAPSGSGSYTPVSVGDTVAAMLPSGADRSGFTFRVSEPGRLALFGSADAPLQLFVVDSALQGTPSSPFPIAIMYAQGQPGDGVLARRTERFDVEPGRTYVVRATHPLGSRTTA